MSNRTQARYLDLDERLLTVDEVAELTALSVAYWRREVRLGRIPSIQFGRAVRIRPTDLNAYMARRTTGKR